MVLPFYTTNISVDLAHHEIFRAKVGKGGIISNNNERQSQQMLSVLQSADLNASSANSVEPDQTALVGAI